jgi:dTDP-4-amino-4,6-dideoxygalactose transaminase
MAAMLCDLGPGDEVILPSYTFVSTANAIVLRGAKPVFVDIRPDTLNIDETLIEEAITSRTKAIFPVHYAGVACEMDAIMSLAKKHHLLVVEDAAQGVHAKYQGRALGSLGHLGCYSFHETKNYICGEGGALCINDPALIEKAEIIREKGTNRSRFLRGQVDKYTWVGVGSSYLPSELAMAFLYGQLENLETIQTARGRVFDYYRNELAFVESQGDATLPTVPETCQSNYHMFYLVTKTAAARDGLLSHLRENKIGAVFHYVPLHTSPMGRSLGYREGSLPVTESLSQRIIRLPFFGSITTVEQDLVIRQIGSYFQQSHTATLLPTDTTWTNRKAS